MNDVTFVEAARGLAQRILISGDYKTPEERIAFAFRLATSRWPTSKELKILMSSFVAQRAAYRRNLKSAKELIRTGESPVPKGLDRKELAAYTVIASLILNLDETITKE
tara:strand:+ start:142 stop:468 length:327 start_codon:yes stop_codon:yes gene_type:complete